MRDALVVGLLSVLPRNAGSRVLGRVARSRASRWLTRAFVQAYGVDLSEAEGTIDEYHTLATLFARRLRAGVRPVSEDPSALVSPVDGTCAFVGCSRDGVVPVAPRRSMALRGLVGEGIDGERDVVVLYLSPSDYHRVHVPREGQSRRWRYIPGSLWPVFPGAVRSIRDLFVRNERLAVEVSTDRGPLWVVLVGAFGVGRIDLRGVDISTNAGRRWSEQAWERPLTRGEELGAFHLGSTVVLIAPPGRWRWSVGEGDRVRVGERLGAGLPLLTAGLLD